MSRDKHDFSFSEHAPRFDAHIGASIPSYKERLLPQCVALSQRFVQHGTNVYDVGCSTGHLLARVHRANRRARPNVTYIGIDSEPAFTPHWNKRKSKGLNFKMVDARTFEYANASVIFSIFTGPFIPMKDKLNLLERLHDGLVPGGALIIAEKTLAESARLQDAITFPYYDYMLEKGFTAEQILEKERGLRGYMTLLTDAELLEALRNVGFREIHPIWRSYCFAGYLALKGPDARYRRT
jgi:tRNA (cmo5U34)-methyltransferase